MSGRYQQLVEWAPEGIVVHDGERILEVNAALLELAGASRREQVVGQPVSGLLEHPYLRGVGERLQAMPVNVETRPLVRDRMHRVDGAVRDVEVRTQLFLEHGAPRAHMMLHDITDRLTAERALQEQAERMRTEEKLEKIRVLAGGVAHEINNVLQIILGFAGILTEDRLTREQQADVDEIVRAASRGATITNQLLQYSRQAPHAPQAVELGEVVRRIVEAISFGTMTGTLRLTVDGEHAGFVWLDPGNLRQMLENLVANAYRATRARGEIAISVQGTVTTSDRTTSDGHRLPAGAYGTVTVRDTGVGMTPEVQRQIFEPFFTASEVGDGTGLGLAAVQGLVAQNGGHLTCESAPDKGSTFTLWFRVLRAET